LANIASRKDLDDDVPTKRVLEDEEKSNLVSYQLNYLFKSVHFEYLDFRKNIEVKLLKVFT